MKNIKGFAIAFLLITLLSNCSSDDDTGLPPQGPKTWETISQGNNHTVAIRSDGTLWAWGLRPASRLGIGTQQYDLFPQQIGTSADWTAIASGQNFTIALKSNGTIWAFGANDFAQLGIGTETLYQTNPIQVGTDNDWQQIAAGNDHTIAVKNNGTLWRWGSYNYPEWQEGLGADDTPVLVGTFPNTQKIHSGGVHDLAIKADGTLWSWGRNAFGELGIGTTVDLTVPSQMGTNNNWALVSAGRYHSLGLRTDGTLWAWGENNVGQLGIGDDYAHFYNPMQIGTDNSWSTAAAGIVYGLGIKNNGTLWGWGNNYYGQLGNGTVTNTNTPVRIGNESSWVSIFPGFNHTYAKKSDGTLWGWGNNTYGQLGDGTIQDMHTPVLIICPQ